MAKATVCILNWAAPSVIKAKFQQAQTNIVACVVNSDPNKNVALAMTPEFSYKKGQLWMLEASAIKQLATANKNVDKSFILPFTQKSNVGKMCKAAEVLIARYAKILIAR